MNVLKLNKFNHFLMQEDRLSKSMFVKKSEPVDRERSSDMSSPSVVHSQSVRGPRMGVYYPSRDSQRQQDHSFSQGMSSQDIIAGPLKDDKQRQTEKPDPKTKAPLKKQRSWFLW
jgi:hypothetical protein